MAAPVVQSFTFSSGATATTTAATVPASVASGDVLVAILYVENPTTPSTVPTGFVLESSVTVAGTTPHTLRVYWKRASGADSGSYTWGGWTSAWCHVKVIRVTGVVGVGDPVVSLVSTTSTVSSSSSPAPAATGVTPADHLAMLACSLGNGGTWTVPSGWTAGTSPADEGFGAWKTATAPATYSSITASSGAAASDSRCAFVFALFVTPALPPQGARAVRRRGWLRRAGRVALVSSQSVQVAPPWPPVFVQRESRTRPVARRARVTTPVPAQVAAPLVWPVRVSVPRRVLGVLVRRQRGDTTPPVDQVVPVAPRTVRRAPRPSMIRPTRAGQPVPAQTAPTPPAYPPRPVGPRRLAALARRRPTTPVATQSSAPSPAHRPVAPHRFVVPGRRPKVAFPVPTQAAPSPPAYPPAAVSPRRMGRLLRRPQAVSPVPPQAAAPAPPVYPSQGRFPRRVMTGGRRARGATVAPAQEMPVMARVARRFVPLVPRRARASGQPVPAQIAPTPPAYPPRPSTVRRLAALARRGGGAAQVPPPQQAVASAPAWVPRAAGPARRITTARRGRGTTLTPDQTRPPVQGRRARVAARPPVRRTPVAAPPHGQHRPLQQAVRRAGRVIGAGIRRGRALAGWLLGTTTPPPAFGRAASTATTAANASSSSTAASAAASTTSTGPAAAPGTPGAAASTSGTANGPTMMGGGTE